MTDLPTGTVTLLFTDIEGSTRLLHALGDRYSDALAQHRALLRDAFESFGGVEVDTQGDAFFVAFPAPQGALQAAVQAQRALAHHPWPEQIELRVRMGIHTGTPEVSEEGYVGADVHLGARICAAAWGGQIVVSSATAGHLSSDLDQRSDLKRGLVGYQPAWVIRGCSRGWHERTKTVRSSPKPSTSRPGPRRE